MNRCPAPKWVWSDAGGGAEVVVLLVTNSDLRGALWTALTPYRLLGLAFAHDGQQRLQEDVEQGLHHHLHLLLHRCVLEAEEHRGQSDEEQEEEKGHFI